MKTKIKRKQELLADEILTICTKYYNLDLHEKTRKREYVDARQMFFYLVRDFCDVLTLEYIGKKLNKDHATVIHSLEQVENFIENNCVIRENYVNLVKIIESETNFKNVSYSNYRKRNREIVEIASDLQQLETTQLNEFKEIFNNYLKSIEWKQSNGLELTKNILG